VPVAQGLRCADGTLRGLGEKQVAMTEPSGLRLVADPRGFCERLVALGRI
jgi:hypothetical protein